MPREAKSKSKELLGDLEDQNLVSEEKYQSLINNLTDIILEGNSKTIVSYASPQCYDIIGYDPAEIVGKSALDFIHPEDVLKIVEAIKTAINTGEIISVPKYRLLHKNGNSIFVSARGKFIGNIEDGKFIVAIRDINIRVEIEQKLKESEEKYKHLFHSSPYGVILIDFEDRIIDVNSTIENLFGYRERECIGEDFFKLKALPSDIIPLLKRRFELYKKGERLDPIEFQIFKYDGIKVWINPQVSLINLGNKTFIQIIVQDITEKKQADLKLNESVTKYKLISENANDLILIVSEDLNIEFANKEPLLKISGYSVEEVINKRALNFIHFDDAKNALVQFYEAFNKKGSGSIEARIIHKDGHFVNVEINGSLFQNEKGERKALLITRDITERKNAEKIILEDNKKLLELSQIKSELITTTSHELKVPLNSIFAASQYLLSNLKDEIGEESIKFVEMIHRGSQKLKILIENLLDTSKIESEKFSLHLQENNIVEVTNNIINDIKYWADERNINIVVDHPSELKVLVDRIKIEQVIINLLSNAIKYTLPGGEIHVKIYEEDQWVRISIKDNGIGLTKKEIKGLFKKFGKIERYGKDFEVESEGTGLGLYISKEIVELHEGKILVDSKGQNQGSTFIILLPRVILLPKA
ncbi:MAG: PAS domain S-box protein [Candidatus Hermodarchaeota archaeon]